MPRFITENRIKTAKQRAAELLSAQAEFFSPAISSPFYHPIHILWVTPKQPQYPATNLKKKYVVLHSFL